MFMKFFHTKFFLYTSTHGCVYDLNPSLFLSYHLSQVSASNYV